MKKMVSFISALAMCAVMAAPMASSAAGEEDITNITPASSSQSASITASAVVPTTYKVTIPDKLDNTENTTLTIGASDVCLEPNKELQVSVSSGTWKLKHNEADATVAYQLKEVKEKVEAEEEAEEEAGEETEEETGEDTEKVATYDAEHNVVLKVKNANPTTTKTTTEDGEEKIITTNVLASDSVTLELDVTEDALVAGTYEDTLTFTVSVK